MSAPTYEIRREGEINYAKPLARALLRDSRLSFAARGLFSFLWDLPQNWRANSSHLVSQSPQGKDAVRTMLKELEAVGAMRDEVIRGAGGKLAGKRWVLVSPDIWAVESPLKKTPDPEAAPEDISTEGRVSRLSEKPTIGETDTKVLLIQGSSNISTTTSPKVIDEIDDLVEAALWAARKGGRKINNEAGFRHKVRTRISSSKTGPSAEDIQSLLAWREAGKRAASQQEQASNQPKDKNMNRNLNQHLDLDMDTCEMGVRFLSAELREKVSKLTRSACTAQNLAQGKA